SAADAVPPPVPGYPIGRCVRVLGVTSPEDAKKAGFEYLELALQDLLPLSDVEFDKVVTRLRGIGIPLVSGYGFLPANLNVFQPSRDMYDALKHGLNRAEKLGLQM